MPAEFVCAGATCDPPDSHRADVACRAQSLSSPCSSSPASLLSRYHPSSTSPPRLPPPSPRCPPSPSRRQPQSKRSNHRPLPYTRPYRPRAPPALSHTEPLVYSFCCLSLLREVRTRRSATPGPLSP